MSNLAHLFANAARTRPSAALGTFAQHDELSRVTERAREVSIALQKAGLRRGDVVALIGENCASYIAAFVAVQQVGARTALVNPAYPDEFLAGMLDDLMPSAIVWIARAPGDLLERDILHIDATEAWDGAVAVLRGARRALVGGATGEDCAPEEIAAYLHTSGTSGKPKFCALSHGYFIRLARYFADTISLSRDDVVVAPLPLFHINPMGYGIIGGLSVGASVFSMEKFSVPEFWPAVKQNRVSVLILHGPPAGMLMAKSTLEDARGHCVRISFFSDPKFLKQFDIPIGVGGYGSTEAGGYCHSQKFRPDDANFPPEGATHLSGQARHDLEWRLGDNDEILVRGRSPLTLFSGYAKAGKIDPHLDKDGWFHTGDRGRIDEEGNLIFVERSSESIRVNAEYVPIDLVEERLRRVPSLDEFALWRVDSPTRGHEAVVYTTARGVNVDELKTALADLPKYMQPTRLIHIERIPRDAGVGKTQRRLLGEQAVLDVTPL